MPASGLTIVRKAQCGIPSHDVVEKHPQTIDLGHHAGARYLGDPPSHRRHGHLRAPLVVGCSQELYSLTLCLPVSWVLGVSPLEPSRPTRRDDPSIGCGYRRKPAATKTMELGGNCELRGHRTRSWFMGIGGIQLAIRFAGNHDHPRMACSPWIYGIRDGGNHCIERSPAPTW